VLQCNHPKSDLHTASIRGSLARTSITKAIILRHGLMVKTQPLRLSRFDRPSKWLAHLPS